MNIVCVRLRNLEEVEFGSRFLCRNFLRVTAFRTRDKQLLDFFLVAKNIIRTISAKFQLVLLLFKVRPFYGRNAVD